VCMYIAPSCRLPSSILSLSNGNPSPHPPLRWAGGLCGECCWIRSVTDTSTTSIKQSSIHFNSECTRESGCRALLPARAHSRAWPNCWLANSQFHRAACCCRVFRRPLSSALDENGGWMDGLMGPYKVSGGLLARCDSRQGRFFFFG